MQLLIIRDFHHILLLLTMQKLRFNTLSEFPQVDSRSESEEEQVGSEVQKKKKKAKKKKKKSSSEVSSNKALVVLTVMY